MLGNPHRRGENLQRAVRKLRHRRRHRPQRLTEGRGEGTMLGRLQTENPHGDMKKEMLHPLYTVSSHESVGLYSHYRHAEGRAICWADTTPSDASTSQQPPAQTDALAA